MSPTTPGLHHVTAIAGDPQENADFYVDTLGLRFVKRTINHDDTGTYHFYFGDEGGTPGTNITFFPWTDRGRQGEFGAGQTQATAYLIPTDSVDYWQDRLESAGLDVDRTERFDDPVLGVSDPDGIRLELVAPGGDVIAESDATPWEDGPVPTDHQLRGFHSVTLAVSEFGPTETILTDVLGYELEAETEAEAEADANTVTGSASNTSGTSTNGRRRYHSAAGGPGSIVDLVETDAGRGRMGVGTVHHVAFEAADLDEQEQWREAYADQGLRPSRVIDRKYFQSIYTRELGGILFEMATTGPGFTVDEAYESLGSDLVLPSQLEEERDQIESQLPPFDEPEVTSADE
ncbi:glyoxalase/bleomycin resistance protein/dioxygenase [Natrialba chahannaoensis JCM 10990]|uniref:Glyoxalase/bleomycin resistance protein/dioxygenase n=1 Tax=Natrialba chahannaoensis JCM 10990 TaxID=1227492 RepID=M0A8X6_9EURY|nr:ring-cleaving dioxygenase [Natrialba chahannaoensis]ELY94821.1 glyoxalase/bleomycin resistance protein/dioxygenase [Natrialba chahannaoensis JCM 10990]